jgi:hypothetical protein
MRRIAIRLAAWSIGALIALGAGDGHAASSPFSGNLAIQIATLAPVVVSGSGTATVNGSSGPGPLTALALPAGVFQATGHVLPVSDPAAAPIKGIQFTVGQQAGTFAGVAGSGSFGGVLPLAGFTKVCLFGPCTAAVANIQIALSVVGAGGYAIQTGAMNLTVVGAPWTTGTVAAGTMTAMGGFGTVGTSQVVSLVTPIWISTHIGASAVIPAFGFLNLVRVGVPEPGTLVLIGSGVVALVLFGRTRRT